MEYEALIEYLNIIFFKTTILNWLKSILTLLAGFIIIKIYRFYLSNKIYKLVNKIHYVSYQFIKSMESKIILLFQTFIIYLSLNIINLPVKLNHYIDILLMIISLFLVVLLIQTIIVNSIKKYFRAKVENVEREKVLYLILFIIKLFIWLLAFLVLLDNLNIEITGLLTGLGVGGIAIAFASQAILNDIFSYFTILFDKPFEIGDFIIIGEYMGTIEHIGLKTTKMRSLGGEQIVVSNTDLVNSRINNYKRMERRRINFSFGVLYKTELEKIKMIPDLLEDIINSIEKTEFDRAHFGSFGDFSLVFQVVYYVLDSDYKVYMDIQEKINLKIKEEFKKHDIEFAFPTRSIYLETENTSIEDDINFGESNN